MLPMFNASLEAMSQVGEAARLGEEAGFDSLWIGDHLAFKFPLLESSLVLATAAATTKQVALGFGVLQLAMRPVAWAAKQIASLQILSQDRLILGVGVGGENPAEWVAAGVNVTERGKRTDAALQALPDLLAGRSVTVQEPVGVEIPALEPAAKMPPIWIGGRSDIALQRTARSGVGWLAQFVSPEQVRQAQEKLKTLAGELGRPIPAIAVSLFVNVNSNRAKSREEVAQITSHYLGQPFEKIGRWIGFGEPEDVAEYLMRLLEAGVSDLVLLPAAYEPLYQYEGLSQVRELLLPYLRVQ
jgi:alkanesulfonate monooxygenase SsuD/methylene tetrahydromethanopterin reductase-like flavin-dependent oxidoreductase (luciferase family)